MIPAYNEQDRIGPTLDRMCEYLSAQNYTWQLIVVNDGSKDDTLSISQERAAKHPEIVVMDCQPNHGKGYVVRQGMLKGNADWLLISDADLATPIEEIEKLLPAATSDNVIVIGSRPLKESQLEVRQPLYRELGGRGFNKLVQMLGVPGIKDTQCGFKLFSDRAAKDIFGRCKTNRWGFDFEALMIGKDLGYTIAEIGVKWRHIEGSKFAPFRDGPKMLKELIALRFAGKKKRCEPNGELRAD